jgi:hypothetical protein
MTQPKLINRSGLEYDTDTWRAERNAKLLGWVGDANAAAFLLLFSDMCEVFDDLIDKDKPVTDEDIIRTLFSAMVDIPMNPFFAQYRHQIVPVVITGINAWLDANKLERGSKDDQVLAYVLRDWVIELVMFVIYLTRGRSYLHSVSMDVRSYFNHHETLDQYREGLKC